MIPLRRNWVGSDHQCMCSKPSIHACMDIIKVISSRVFVMMHLVTMGVLTKNQ